MLHKLLFIIFAICLFESSSAQVAYVAPIQSRSSWQLSGGGAATVVSNGISLQAGATGRVTLSTNVPLVDLSVYSRLEITLTQAFGRWKLMLTDSTDAVGPTDTLLINSDSLASGTLSFSIPLLANWRENKRFKVLLECSGMGASCILQDLRVRAPLVAKGGAAWILDLGSLSSNDEAYLAYALQGLINRGEQPRLFFIDSKDNTNYWGIKNNKASREGLLPSYTSSVRKKYPIDQAYLDYIVSTYGYSFSTVTLAQLLASTSSYYKGIVLYDGSTGVSAVPLITTVCGVEGAVPVTTQLLATYNTQLAAKPVIRDIRGLFTTRVAAHTWLINNYLKRTNKQLAFSYWNQEKVDRGMDYAVQSKAFTFELSMASSVVNYDGDGSPVTVDNVQAGLADQIFAYLNPAATILGWCSEGEFVMISRLGQVGKGLLLNGWATNSSFFAGIDDTVGIDQPRVGIAAPALENKVYLTFSTNEGDTHKSNLRFMNDGQWLEYRRGDVPFNWPYNPKLAYMMPALHRLYMRMATQSDYFFMPTSGANYYNASFSSTQERNRYALETNKYRSVIGSNILDLWWNGFTGDQSWVQSMGVTALTSWTGDFGVSSVLGYTQIRSPLYYKLYDMTPEFAAKYLQKVTASIPANKPWFVNIYGCDPQFAFEVTRRLSRNTRFKTVTMDQFAALAALAQPQISGLRVNFDQAQYNTYVDSSNTYRAKLPVSEYLDLFPEGWGNAGNSQVSFTDTSLCVTISSSPNYAFLSKTYSINLDSLPFLSYTPQLVVGTWQIKIEWGGANMLLTSSNATGQCNGQYYWNVKALTGASGVQSMTVQPFIFGSIGSRVCVRQIAFLPRLSGSPTIRLSAMTPDKTTPNKVQFINRSLNGVSYHWNFGTGPTPATSNAVNPVVVFPGTGVYPIQLQATNCNGTSTYNFQYQNGNATAEKGFLRFNTSLSKFEVYNGSIWSPLH